MWIFARFAKAMIFACLQIFGILCSQIILVKRSASQISALGPDVLGTVGG